MRATTAPVELLRIVMKPASAYTGSLKVSTTFEPTATPVELSSAMLPPPVPVTIADDSVGNVESASEFEPVVKFHLYVGPGSVSFTPAGEPALSSAVPVESSATNA